MCQEPGVGGIVGYKYRCPFPGFYFPSLQFSGFILVWKHITNACPLGAGETESALLGTHRPRKSFLAQAESS